MIWHILTLVATLGVIGLIFEIMSHDKWVAWFVVLWLIAMILV